MLFALIIISAIFVPLGISGAITYFVYKHSEWIKQKNKTILHNSTQYYTTHLCLKENFVNNSRGISA